MSPHGTTCPMSSGTDPATRVEHQAAACPRPSAYALVSVVVDTLTA